MKLRKEKIFSKQAKVMKKIAILMSTYNGEMYLKTQIDSILNQEDVDISLLVRDDGSSDSTLSILEEYANDGKLSLYKGDNLRSAQSFFELIFNAPEADYYALSDQDDYWEKDKLIHAVNCLELLEKNKPLLYCSATKLVDKNLKIIKNKRKSGVVNFNQAVITSNATGCTMCFNRELLNIIRLHRPVVRLMHDAWIHKLCLAVGGIVYYDNNSYICYRQHGNNVIGGTSSLRKRWKRRWRNFKTLSRIRSSAIIEIYENYLNIMPQRNKKIAKCIVDYRKSIFGRIKLLFNTNIHFTSKISVDIYYRLAVVLGIF